MRGVELLERLHHGRSSSVYLARRERDGARVVLKCLERPRPGPLDIPRFRREARILSAVHGGGVVEFEGLEEQPEGLTLVMRDIGGLSLTRARMQARIDLRHALLIARGAAFGLQTVHAAGVVHKDVSPGNIVWARDTGLVELIDFGISSELSREHTADLGMGHLEGTLAFLAPEQTGHTGRSIDWRTDFYALGAVLYELIAGEPPFAGDDPLDVVHGHLAREPVALSRIADVPEAVSEGGDQASGEVP